jgi:tetratricopeptide (TPR) repeat protein
MNAKLVATIFFFVSFAAPATAQNEMIAEAFDDFSTSRFWQHEEISITWNMEGTIQADLNDGINNLFEEKNDLAEYSFTQVLLKDSILWQAYYFRAAARKKLEKLKGAQLDLQRAVKLHANFYEGYVELAKVYHLRHQVEESERAIRKAINIDKSKAAAYYVKGDISLEQNLLKNAINNYKECLEADSLFHDARIKLSILDLIAKKNIKLAIQHLDKVLAYDSLQKSALLFRGILLIAENKKQSIRDFTNLILVSPNNMMAYYLRGAVLTELENYSKAFLDFQKVIKATSTSDNNFAGQQTWLDKKIDLQNAGAYTLTRIYGLNELDATRLKQAYCQIITQSFDKGIAAINQMDKPNEEPLAVYLKAVAYEHKGEHNKAYQFYDLALQLDNEIADAYKKRAIYEQELKLWQKSVDDLSAVLRLNPEAYIIYRIRGVSYFHLTRFDRSIADFTTYLKNDSLNKEVLGFRAIAYQQNHQKLNAYIDFAVSGNIQAFNFKEMNHLVDSVLIKGDTTIALNALNYFVLAEPRFTEAYVQMFKIYMAKKEWTPIRNQITRAVRNSRLDVDKTQHAYLLTLQAMNYVKESHEEDAINTFGEAIKFDKKNALAYLERGKILLAMGKVSKAESDLKQAASLGNLQAKELLATGIPDNN